MLSGTKTVMTRERKCTAVIRGSKADTRWSSADAATSFSRRLAREAAAATVEGDAGLQVGHDGDVGGGISRTPAEPATVALLRLLMSTADAADCDTAITSSTSFLLIV